ncbi:DotD/TraH family lipoprotein [Vibrio sp. 10N.261.46.E12]|uniref:DotD/TraH family lipoprotein n=1 Tax=unclassified Vibrio TaxID=2614977 RepID=UPI0009776CC3|nr:MULTISPECIES: DotD/TraH family lipoprotein [unclassified Vibrio]OMO34481.1 hypothetical protein BH584_12700 [Vibrio sp. 10N.261.45.E1]PMJ26196.1 hypothetical protein BCU27_09585 [Vibrio sp. 10N.286.45.B6]PML82810.1 hypothetical protein BCT66_20180 [Vibrio sp. 10N.261.49.E11]PMM90334.1 hypothetical protein BCT46_23605 [Vibrio sp. 10N.261.46.E8]PMN43954.1 hypothetical protein BCT32_00885 [Vibrio sp. 10N.261.45.E11]
MRRIFLAVVIALVMSGCQSTSKSTKDEDKAYISNELEITLAELANKAVQSKQIMLAHQSAMARLNPELQHYKPVLDVPDGLGKVIPVRTFYGDALEPLNLIAKLTGYKLKVKGAQSNTETLWVSIRESERSAIDLIDDIAGQIDKRKVDIHVWATPNETMKGVILVSYDGGM